MLTEAPNPSCTSLWWGYLVPSPWEEEQHLVEGVGGSSSWSPLVLHPQQREHKQIPVLGGRGGLAPQTLEGCPGTQDKNRAPYTEGGEGGVIQERYSNTKATVEHNTTGEGWEIKTKPGRGCPTLAWLPRRFRAASGQEAESLCAAPEGAGLGAGRGRAGGGGEMWADRGPKEGLHIPLLLGNERPVVLRNHVLS